MRTTHFRLAGFFAFILTLAAPAARGADRDRAAEVAPFAGPSWLRSLSITVDTTALGHMGGGGDPVDFADAARFSEHVRAAVTAAGRDDAQARRELDGSFVVDGAEIYRLNCRACHGPAGEGAPPEVASLLGPARSLSPELVALRDHNAQRPGMARELAADAERAIRDRLHNGGKSMPPFRYLSRPEVDALVDYLRTLGGAPRASLHAPQVTETVARLGEQVVQGNCRICHDATGPAAGHRLMMAGRIPALAQLPGQLSLEGVVHKVRHGWSGMQGMMHEMSRMPVFSYLSDDEVAAAYLYLTYYPPAQ